MPGEEFVLAEPHAVPVERRQVRDFLDHADRVFRAGLGWLSSNNVLIHATEGEAGAVLVDSSHVNHAGQTVAHMLQATHWGLPSGRCVSTCLPRFPAA